MSAEAVAFSDDAFLGGALTLRQPLKGFRSGHEAVLLAASIPAVAGQSALEAGLGTGAASLCLLKRVPGVKVAGLEAHPDTALLARENALRNKLEERLEVLEGRVEAPPEVLRQQSFHHVFANPPFLEEGEGLSADGEMRAGARMGPQGTLVAWADFCIRRAGPGGTVTLLHRADRLARILQELEGRCGAILIYPLWPKASAPAKRVIVRGVKGSRAPLQILPGLVLHTESGAYTGEVEATLRDGAPLAALTALA